MSAQRLNLGPVYSKARAVSSKISVVTATFNSEKTILGAVNSLVDQTYPIVEHVVVDGASEDRTLDLVRQNSVSDLRIDSRVDSGIYDALNRGIGLATGDIVGFLHSDDFFPDSGVLEKIARVFEDPAVDMCFGDLAYVAKSDTSKVLRRWRSGVYKRHKLRLGWMPPHPTLYIRRELIQQNLFNVDYRISGDYEAILRLFNKDVVNAVYIPEELVYMRLGGASNGSFSNILKKMAEDWRAIKTNQVGGLVTLVFKNIRKLPQLSLKKIKRD